MTKNLAKVEKAIKDAGLFYEGGPHLIYTANCTIDIKDGEIHVNDSWMDDAEEAMSEILSIEQPLYQHKIDDIADKVTAESTTLILISDETYEYEQLSRGKRGWISSVEDRRGKRKYTDGNVITYIASLPSHYTVDYVGEEVGDLDTPTCRYCYAETEITIPIYTESNLVSYYMCESCYNTPVGMNDGDEEV